MEGQVYLEFTEVDTSVSTFVQAVKYFLDIVSGQIISYTLEEGHNFGETQGLVIIHVNTFEQFSQILQIR